MTSQKTDKAAQKENRITVMVVVICILFIVLTTPLTIFFVIVFDLGMFVYIGREFALYRAIIVLLALSNHAINFLLYAITSSNFRDELKSMCTGKKGKRSASQSSSTKQSDVSHSEGLPVNNHI